jgi:hypothetical protein
VPKIKKIYFPESILRGSQARKSAFWTDCTFKSAIGHVFVPVYYIKCSMGVVFLEVLKLKETASLGDKLTEKGKFAVCWFYN